MRIDAVLYHLFPFSDVYKAIWWEVPNLRALSPRRPHRTLGKEQDRRSQTRVESDSILSILQPRGSLTRLQETRNTVWASDRAYFVERISIVSSLQRGLAMSIKRAFTHFSFSWTCRKWLRIQHQLATPIYSPPYSRNADKSHHHLLIICGLLRLVH